MTFQHENAFCFQFSQLSHSEGQCCIRFQFFDELSPSQRKNIQPVSHINLIFRLSRDELINKRIHTYYTNVLVLFIELNQSKF